MSYLTIMAHRLYYMRLLLKDTGSIYLHCDPHMSHYLKVLMDMIFGEKNFRNEIAWCYKRWTNVSSDFQRMHNVILRYSKSDNYCMNKLSESTESSEKRVQRGYHTGHPTMENGKRVTNLIVYDREKAKKAIETTK